MPVIDLDIEGVVVLVEELRPSRAAIRVQAQRRIGDGPVIGGTSLLLRVRKQDGIAALDSLAAGIASARAALVSAGYDEP